MGDSSEEYWTMHESVIQLYRVSEERRNARKTLSARTCFVHGDIVTSLAEEAPANICASSRGNTEGASVIRNNWA
eukprot:CAMPEP_0181385234 /NCGR_PEP_ID=MMETSP1106-20121128/22439_1 /TAXON_ID=81844 /ORGANISM="Mantoniella antarctica, Strain SL-175" /LENGTH=74 /DNA_ID=CAMNT_0023505257 /DNA_START=335 /DNA_END=559 /DNA_ORIENTATION=+